MPARSLEKQNPTTLATTQSERLQAYGFFETLGVDIPTSHLKFRAFLARSGPFPPIIRSEIGE